VRKGATSNFTGSICAGVTGYFGFKIEGTPNQEGYGLHRVFIHCQNSPGSYGFWGTDANADSTVIDRQSSMPRLLAAPISCASKWIR
jgi:hypothetical protein